MLAQITAFKTRIQAGIGEVVLAMLNLPRYRNQTLADVMHLVVEPMTRDRIAIARAGGEGKIEETAIAIWASVSDEVDAKIREQIQARVFPVRLKAEDWNSGETYWLLDVIAPSQKVATAVLANFKQVVKDKPVRIHPIVSQLVDPAVLEKMKVRPVGRRRERDRRFRGHQFKLDDGNSMSRHTDETLVRDITDAVSAILNDPALSKAVRNAGVTAPLSDEDEGALFDFVSAQPFMERFKAKYFESESDFERSSNHQMSGIWRGSATPALQLRWHVA